MHHNLALQKKVSSRARRGTFFSWLCVGRFIPEEGRARPGRRGAFRVPNAFGGPHPAVDLASCSGRGLSRAPLLAVESSSRSARFPKRAPTPLLCRSV